MNESIYVEKSSELRLYHLCSFADSLISDIMKAKLIVVSLNPHIEPIL